MNNFRLIKEDITDILINKSMGEKDAVIYTDNIILIESFLGKDLNVFNKSHVTCVLKLTRITQEDVLALQEYLDYICMIKE